MLIFLFLFSILLVESRSKSSQPRSLNIQTCSNQSQYKWIVSIQSNEKHTCNGVILDQKSILTTGLCCLEKLKCSEHGNFDHLKIIHGTAAEQGFPTGDNCMITGVEKCIIHPNFKKQYGFVEYDTAIIVLKRNMNHFTIAPFYEDKNLDKDFSEFCTKGSVVGWWLHDKQQKPKALLECFSVTIKHLKKCAEVTTFVYVKQSKNHTLTCSYDASNRYEVCSAFYGAPLICEGKMVGMVSHKYNLSEQCLEVSPFYYSRLDWSCNFRNHYVKGQTRKKTARSILNKAGEPKCVHNVPFWLLLLIIYNIVSHQNNVR